MSLLLLFKGFVFTPPTGPGARDVIYQSDYQAPKSSEYPSVESGDYEQAASGKYTTIKQSKYQEVK